MCSAQVRSPWYWRRLIGAFSLCGRQVVQNTCSLNQRCVYFSTVMGALVDWNRRPCFRSVAGDKSAISPIIIDTVAKRK